MLPSPIISKAVDAPSASRKGLTTSKPSNLWPSCKSSVSSERAPDRRAETMISESQNDNWWRSSSPDAVTMSSASGRWTDQARYVR